MAGAFGRNHSGAENRNEWPPIPLLRGQQMSRDKTETNRGLAERFLLLDDLSFIKATLFPRVYFTVTNRFYLKRKLYLGNARLTRLVCFL